MWNPSRNEAADFIYKNGREQINKSVDIALAWLAGEASKHKSHKSKFYYLLYHKLILLLPLPSSHTQQRVSFSYRRSPQMPKYLYIHLKWNCNVIEKVR